MTGNCWAWETQMKLPSMMTTMMMMMVGEIGLRVSVMGWAATWQQGIEMSVSGCGWWEMLKSVAMKAWV